MELSLRPGEQHSASETEYNFERVLPLAASLISTPLLVRADAGFCSLKLMQSINQEARLAGREMAFVIKWNPRKSPVEAIAKARVADIHSRWEEKRVGKRECLWEESLALPVGNATESGTESGGENFAARRIYRLTERTIDKRGNALLLPDYVLEGWTSTLPATFDSAAVIALYRDHATHEQFHAEFKTDMDLERLPSGKFDTNYLVCQLAAIAMNLLRLVGQNTLNEENSPLRHKISNVCVGLKPDLQQKPKFSRCPSFPHTKTAENFTQEIICADLTG